MSAKKRGRMYRNTLKQIKRRSAALEPFRIAGAHAVLMAQAMNQTGNRCGTCAHSYECKLPPGGVVGYAGGGVEAAVVKAVRAGDIVVPDGALHQTMVLTKEEDMELRQALEEQLRPKHATMCPRCVGTGELYGSHDTQGDCTMCGGSGRI